MLYLLVYDVSDDWVRDRIREFLKNYGCQHIQYSAFMCELSEAELNEVLRFSERILGGGRGNVMAIPICEKDKQKLIELPKKTAREENLVF